MRHQFIWKMDTPSNLCNFCHVLWCLAKDGVYQFFLLATDFEFSLFSNRSRNFFTCDIRTSFHNWVCWYESESNFIRSINVHCNYMKFHSNVLQTFREILPRRRKQITKYVTVVILHRKEKMYHQRSRWSSYLISDRFDHRIHRQE